MGTGADYNSMASTTTDGGLAGAHMAAAAAAAAAATPATNPTALQLALDPTLQMFPRLIDRQTMNLFGFPAIMQQVSLFPGRSTDRTWLLLFREAHAQMRRAHLRFCSPFRKLAL